LVARDALAAKPPAEREELIERAAAGEKVTARDAAQPRRQLPKPREADDNAESELRKLRSSLKDAKQEARSARSSRDDFVRQLQAASDECRGLRDRVDSLQRENAMLRVILDDPAKLQQRLEQLNAAAFERDNLEIPGFLRRTEVAGSEQQNAA
jgi:chromosome segregation ATPase